MTYKVSIMALKSYGSQLEEVQTAITKVMSGQRYEINGRSMQRADLEFLHKRESDLIERVNEFGYDTIAGQSVSRGAYRVSYPSE